MSAHHLADARGLLHAVAVQQEEIGDAHHIFARNRAAAVARASEQTPSIALRFADALDEFVNAVGLQNRVVVGGDIALVVHLHEHVAPAASEQPFRPLIGRTDDGGFVGETLVLPKIKVADDGDHPEVVRAVEDARQPSHGVRAQRPSASNALFSHGCDLE